MSEQEKILEIKKKVSENSLYIGRIPRIAKQNFIDLANEEFEGDYGMTLKWLLDFRNGLLSSPNQILLEQINTLAEELSQLKSASQEPTKNGIRTVGGKIIPRNGGMKNE